MSVSLTLYNFRIPLSKTVFFLAHCKNQVGLYEWSSLNAGMMISFSFPLNDEGLLEDARHSQAFWVVAVEFQPWWWCLQFSRYRIDLGLLFSKGYGLLKRTLGTSSTVFPTVKTSTTESIWILKKVRRKSKATPPAVGVSSRASFYRGEWMQSRVVIYREMFLRNSVLKRGITQSHSP